MDYSILGERDHSIDLESGGTTSEEDANILLGRVWSGSVEFDGSIRGENCHVMSSPQVMVENEDFVTLKKGEIMGYLEQKKVKDQRSAKKPPKPPRGPSLDAADKKLIKEISELAMLKRARIERRKALKKMKAAKATSVNTNLYATVITVLFCFVIIFQGIFSRGSSHTSIGGSPEPAIVTSEGLISAQYYKNLSESDTEGPGSLPPNFIDQVSSSRSQEEGRRIAG